MSPLGRLVVSVDSCIICTYFYTLCKTLPHVVQYVLQFVHYMHESANTVPAGRRREIRKEGGSGERRGRAVGVQYWAR
jgi:hypothetical protein